MPPAKKASRRAPRAPSTSEVRRDEKGGYWSAAQVAAEVDRIVRALDPNAPASLGRKTRFSADLGWDDWFKLSVIKPVRRRMHESLSAKVVLDRVKTVGDLADYVWSSMEIAS